MKRNMCKKMLPVLIAALFTLLFSIPAMAATPKLKSYPSSKVTAKQIATELSKAFKINRITTPSKKQAPQYGEPNYYKTKANFYDKKYSKVYCSVEVFRDAYDAATRCGELRSYRFVYTLLGITEDVPFTAYRYKNVVVRLNNKMPQKYAIQYYNTLKKIVK